MQASAQRARHQRLRVDVLHGILPQEVAVPRDCAAMSPEQVRGTSMQAGGRVDSTGCQVSGARCGHTTQTQTLAGSRTMGAHLPCGVLRHAGGSTRAAPGSYVGRRLQGFDSILPETSSLLEF